MQEKILHGLMLFKQEKHLNKLLNLKFGMYKHFIICKFDSIGKNDLVGVTNFPIA